MRASHDRAGALRPLLPRRLPSLDGVRGFAVVWVILYHAWVFRCEVFSGRCAAGVESEPVSVTAMYLLFGHGDLAVDLFFVMSGYLIMTVLLQAAREGHRFPRMLGRFLIRRFLRIYPALAVAVPLNALYFYHYFMPALSGEANPLYAGCRAHWWPNYLLINNVSGLAGTLISFDDGRLACLPWTWSVSIEAQFYLASPFLVAAVLRTRAARGDAARWWSGCAGGVLLAALALASSLALALHFGLQTPGIPPERLEPYMTWLYANPLTRCTPYLFGMAAAAYRILGPQRAAGESPAVADRPGRGLRWAVRGAWGIIAFFLMTGVLPIFPAPGFNLFLLVAGRALWGAAAALLVAVSADVRAAGLPWVRALRHRLWRPIAEVSFSMFLLQFIGIESARWVFAGLGFAAYESLAVFLGYAGLSVVLSFALGTALYRLVERPFMQMRPAA
jgi:peptidoglycan/LPS O-acetylase OafA/YrhL